VRYDPTSKAESDPQIKYYPQTSLRSGELRRGRLRRLHGLIHKQTSSKLKAQSKKASIGFNNIRRFTLFKFCYADLPEARFNGVKQINAV
jgi:hypothetical protein